MRRVGLILMLLPITGLLAACDASPAVHPYAFRLKFPRSAHPISRWLPYEFWEDGKLYETIWECEDHRLSLQRSPVLRVSRHARCVPLR